MPEPYVRRILAPGEPPMAVSHASGLQPPRQTAQPRLRAATPQEVNEDYARGLLSDDEADAALRPPPREPTIRARTWGEAASDTLRSVYDTAASSLPGRVADALGVSDLRGMTRSFDEPPPKLSMGMMPVPEFGGAGGEARALLSGEAAAEHLSRAPVEHAGERLLVSPRILGAKGKAFTPAEPGRILTPTIEAATQDPAYLKKLADEARRSPMLRPREAAGSDLDVVHRFADRGAENIDALFDMAPPGVRSRGGLWYPGGQGIGDAIAKDAGVNANAGVGVLARLSPGTDWDQNINNAQRVGRWWKEFNRTDQPFTQAHLDQLTQSLLDSSEEWIKSNKMTGAERAQHQATTARRIAETQGYLDHPWSALPDKQRAQLVRAHSVLNEPQSYAVYAPEGHIAAPVALSKTGQPMNVKWQSYDNLSRALAMLDDPSDANISRLLGQGHKIRSFFNNLSVPTDPRSLTADVHNVAGTNLRPLGASTREVLAVTGGTPGSALTGIQGTYPLYQEATTRAAARRGLIPNTAQSIPWETTRGLFSPSQRSQESFRAAATQLWEDFQRGKISLYETQGRLHDLAGGVTSPEWAGYPGAAAAAPK